MARITVEDCLDKVDNRFELVMVSSKRARQLQSYGQEPQVPVDDDKPTVIALREIAEGLVGPEILTEKPPVDLEQAQAALQDSAVAAVLEARQREGQVEEEAQDEDQSDDEPVDAAGEQEQGDETSPKT